MYVKVILFSILVVAVQHISRLIFFCGFHKRIYNHLPGPCSTVPGIENGSEDIKFLPGGLALISSGYTDNLAVPYKRDDADVVKGRILLYDVERKKLEELSIIGELHVFVPHGLDFWIDDKTGSITLFVVNHPPGGDTMEIFDLDLQEKQLYHRETVRHSAFTSLNSVVATSSNSFFATNFFGVTNMLYRQLHLLLMLPFGNVIHYDGGSAITSEAAGGFYMPNGIAISNDRQYVYLNVFQELRVFKVMGKHRLQPVKVVALHTNPDNVYVEKDTGDVYLGCQPKIHEMAEHLKNSHLPAASQVIRVRFDDVMNAKVTEMFADDGDTVSAVTVGARYKHHLLIGTVFTKLLHCNVTVP